MKAHDIPNLNWPLLALVLVLHGVLLLTLPRLETLTAPAPSTDQPEARQTSTTTLPVRVLAAEPSRTQSTPPAPAITAMAPEPYRQRPPTSSTREVESALLVPTPPPSSSAQALAGRQAKRRDTAPQDTTDSVAPHREPANPAAQSRAGLSRDTGARDPTGKDSDRPIERAAGDIDATARGRMSGPDSGSADASSPLALNGSAGESLPADRRIVAPRIDASWAGNQPPPYPAIARRLRLEGEVRLSVHVDADGRVLAAKVAHSSGHALLDSTAIESVKKWRFEPATDNGSPVADWYHDWRWHFRFND